MKELKKKYIKLEMKVYELKSRQALLVGSGEKRYIPDDDEENDGWFN